MIFNFTREEEKAWQRQMARYARRQKRQMRCEMIKRVAAPVALVACLIVTVWTVWPGRGPDTKPVITDTSAALDSIFLETSPAPLLDTTEILRINPEIRREYDSLVKAEGYREDSL